ncbi:hypothetical protein M0811_03920 [Anaeramoeba ignava]|uniref:Uncharacterized protein n=1 Tax=Anaeramoeba ignava TaxID=1746090 RepID=A0A9Q0M027_ANAIG|nr:hypothetical protein M0811_03920 [Anaeramoeba ignava]
MNSNNPFEFQEKHNQIYNFFLGAMGKRQDKVDKKYQQYCASVQNLLLKKKWGSNTIIKTQNQSITSKIFFSRDFIKLVLFNENGEKTTRNFSYKQIIISKDKNDENSLQLQTDTSGRIHIQFESPTQRNLVAEYYFIVRASMLIQSKLELIEEISNETLLFENDFLNGIVIYQWGMKKNVFQILQIENGLKKNAEITLKKNDIIILMQEKKQKIPTSLKNKLFLHKSNAQRFVLLSQGKSLEFECKTGKSRDFVVSLISLFLKLPSNSSKKIFDSDGEFRINFAKLFQPSNYSNVDNKQHVINEMRNIIYSRYFKKQVNFFIEKIPGMIIMTDDGIQLIFNQNHQIKRKFENCSLFFNRKDLSVLLIEIFDSPIIKRITFCTDEKQDTDLIVNVFFFFKLSQKYDNFVWHEEMICTLDYEMIEMFYGQSNTVEITPISIGPEKLLKRSDTLKTDRQKFTFISERKRLYSKRIQLKLFLHKTQVNSFDDNAILSFESGFLTVIIHNKTVLNYLIKPDLEIQNYLENAMNILIFSVPDTFELKIYDFSDEFIEMKNEVRKTISKLLSKEDEDF